MTHPRPKIDGILWLRLVGQAFIEAGIATNRRVITEGDEIRGTIFLDLEFKRDGKGRHYQRLEIPTSAANDHDLGVVLNALRNHSGMTLHDVDILKGSILDVTRLKHVH